MLSKCLCFMGVRLMPLISLADPAAAHSVGILQTAETVDPQIYKATFSGAFAMPEGDDSSVTRANFVPSIEYRFSEGADFVGKLGIGLNHNSPEYASDGLTSEVLTA